MEIQKTPIEDLLIIKPRVFNDDRGYFFESYNDSYFQKNGLNYNWVQDNQSFSDFGTLRGLHFQKGEHAQAKLVRAIKGRVLDVAVDLREESKTYGQWYSVELTEENFLQLLVPRGFAHGFAVLSETAIFAYKVDNFYNKESEEGIHFADSSLNIDWGVDPKEVKLSPKDVDLRSFESLKGEKLW